MPPRQVKRPLSRLESDDLRKRFEDKTAQYKQQTQYYLKFVGDLNEELDHHARPRGVTVRRELRPQIERIQAAISSVLQNLP
jgi:hypothetical protein